MKPILNICWITTEQDRTGGSEDSTMFVFLFLLKMPGGHAICLRRGGSGRPRCHFLPLCWIYWRATPRRAAMWLCSVCVRVFSHPVSGWDGVSLPWPVLHFSRPSPWDPHSFVPVASAASLPWSYWECWRDTQKDMITFRRNSNLWASPCAFGDRTNNDNLNIPLTDFKF